MKLTKKAAGFIVLGALLTVALTGCQSSEATSPATGQNTANEQSKGEGATNLIRLLPKIRKKRVLKRLKKVRWRRKAMLC